MNLKYPYHTSINTCAPAQPTRLVSPHFICRPSDTSRLSPTSRMPSHRYQSAIAPFAHTSRLFYFSQPSSACLSSAFVANMHCPLNVISIFFFLPRLPLGIFGQIFGFWIVFLELPLCRWMRLTLLSPGSYFTLPRL